MLYSTHSTLDNVYVSICDRYLRELGQKLEKRIEANKVEKENKDEWEGEGAQETAGGGSVKKNT